MTSKKYKSLCSAYPTSSMTCLDHFIGCFLSILSTISPVPISDTTIPHRIILGRPCFVSRSNHIKPFVGRTARTVPPAAASISSKNKTALFSYSRIKNKTSHSHNLAKLPTIFTPLHKAINTMPPRAEIYSESSSFPIEFKPRTGTWASLDVWASSPLKASFSFDNDSSSCSSQKQHRRVRFSQTKNQVQEYMHVSEYTAEEKEACWFHRPDYQAMREHNHATAEKLCLHIPLNLEDECQFGLENRTSRENMISQQITHQAKWALLDEQEEQWRFDACLNHDILAARYSSCTWQAMDRARYIGHLQCTLVQ